MRLVRQKLPLVRTDMDRPAVAAMWMQPHLSLVLLAEQLKALNHM